MKNTDFEYRKINTVVPQLDFDNKGLEDIEAPQVIHSKYTKIGKIKYINGKDVGKALEGLADTTIALFSNPFYGVGVAAANIINRAGDSSVRKMYIDQVKKTCKLIYDEEEKCWQRHHFLREFVPAEGKLGDTVCKNGKFTTDYTGLGHKFFENGDYFEGKFEKGKIKFGIYVFANGTRYLGGFDENKDFIGEGILLYNNGTLYYGNFNQSNYNGFGVRWYTDGVYWGEWSNGLRHGFGCLKLDDNMYEGHFVNDQFNDGIYDEQQN